jgi:hypothetical protein
MEMKNILSKGAYEKSESKRAARNASNIDMSSIIGWAGTRTLMDHLPRHLLILEMRS